MTIPSISDYQEKLKTQPILQSGGKAVMDGTQSDRILVSIITVVYDAEAELEATIKSVINQSYPFIEYIIIDGGSTDKTLEIIRQYEDKISHWISQPDEGIYDAMNKGIALATGQIIGILNAGDIYLKDTLTTVVNIYQQSSNALVTGYCKLPLGKGEHWMIENDDTQKIPYKMIPHPSLFIPQQFYQKYGIFDPTFRIAGDYELVCRLFSQKIPFISSNSILTKMGIRGLSSNYYLGEIESLKARLRYPLLPPYIAIFYSLRSLTTITIHLFLDKLGLWKFIEAYRHGRTR